MKNSAQIVSACLLLALSASSQALETEYRTVPASNDGGPLLVLEYEYGPNKSDRMQSFKTRYQFWKLDPSPRSTRYVATQFSIDPKDAGGGDAMYIGVNPPNSTSGYAGEAHFSYFGSRGGKILSGNCHSDADGGGGITCALPSLVAKQRHTYELEARVVGPTADRTGTIVEGWISDWDHSTDSLVGTYQIGKFEVKIPNAELTNPMSWVEGGADPCPDVARTQIMYSQIFRNSDYSESNSVYVKKITRAKCGASVWPSSGGPLYVFAEYGF